MKNRSLSFLPIVAAVVFSAMALKAQSNAPTSLILPTADWDVKNNVLFALVTTNNSGDYPLNPAWVGVEKVTMTKGYYTNDNDFVNAEKISQWLRCDRLTVYPHRIMPFAPEDRLICNATNVSSPGYVYRCSLPTDDELRAMHDVASVTHFFGFNPFKYSGMHIGMHYFELGPYNSIETLSVEVAGVDSILVRRGYLHAE